MIQQRRALGFGATVWVAAVLGASQPFAQPLPIVEELIEEQLRLEVESEVTDAVERAIEESIEDAVLADVEAAASGAIASTGLLGESDDAASRGSRFLVEIDENGSAIERGVWVVLVPPAAVDSIERHGLTVLERKPLDTLGLVLLRVEAPSERGLTRAALEVALGGKPARVDANHMYGPAHAASTASPATTTRPAGSAVQIGMVDSTVDVGHEAMRRVDVTQRDFVPYDARRTTGHGTAIASIVVGDTPEGTRLCAAGVFFESATGDTTASAASLVEALDWLAGEAVPVIVMSLAGPPNRVLERAIDGVAAIGITVVAAVGNTGPAAPALYPAGYDAVVAVTAVDAGRQVYRYANRGPHVDFAVLGVDVRVAEGEGYGRASGTSFAAARAAAFFARELARPGATSMTVRSRLQAQAIDLDPPGFDETFGFGLLSP